MKLICKISAFCMLLSVLSGCGSNGQRVYYWERPNTGVAWFVRDHNQCLAQADYWPYEWPGLPWGWGTPAPLNLKFDNNSDHGIWAQFEPFPGAHPLYVNSVADDWSMSYDDYEECMLNRNYSLKRPYTEGYQVFYQ